MQIMAEKIETISRRMIAGSTEDYALWLPTYQGINRGLFRTPAYEDNYRSIVISAPEDYASGYLYDYLTDASAGRLVIPEYLAVDQIEDWFVGQAMKKGLAMYQKAMEVRAAFENS
jgi:hypothetical protein